MLDLHAMEEALAEASPALASSSALPGTGSAAHFLHLPSPICGAWYSSAHTVGSRTTWGSKVLGKGFYYTRVTFQVHLKKLTEKKREYELLAHPHVHTLRTCYFQYSPSDGRPLPGHEFSVSRERLGSTLPPFGLCASLVFVLQSWCRAWAGRKMKRSQCIGRHPRITTVQLHLENGALGEGVGVAG